MSEAKVQSYMVIGKCTRQRLMVPYNIDTQRDPTPPVYIHCIASNGVERSRDQKHDEGMWDLSRDLSGISLGSLLVLDPWACVPYIEFSLWSALGSLWDLSSCWCVRDQKHDEGMWDLCPFAADGSCVGNPSFF